MIKHSEKIKKVMRSLIQFTNQKDTEAPFTAVHFFGGWAVACDRHRFAGMKFKYDDFYRGHSLDANLNFLVLDSLPFGLWFVEPRLGDMRPDPVEGATIEKLIEACEIAGEAPDEDQILVNVKGVAFYPKKLLELLKTAPNSCSVYTVSPPSVDFPGIYLANDNSVLALAGYKDEKSIKQSEDWSYLLDFGDLL